MDLNEIAVFAKVAQSGSFTRAARELGMPKSTVSRKVSELERNLGARLLDRTTRKIHLTDAGKAYLGHCERILEEIDEAREAVTRMQAEPRGLLRITAPVRLPFLARLVTDLVDRHPELRVEVVCTDRTIGLVEEGFDVAIRAGTLEDSSLIVRKLGLLKRTLIASPRYFEERSRPRAPKDLRSHECLLFAGGNTPPSWTLRRQSEVVEVPLSGRVVVNDFLVLQASALAGHGIAMLPAPMCEPDVRAGRLEVVLPAWKPLPVPIAAIYPSARHRSPKVTVFLELLQAHMAKPGR